jgi:hypothetical protein
MKNRSRLPLKETVAAVGAATAAGVYLLRRWQRRWSASPEEIACRMPLDGEVENPTYVTNRAVTIRALPEHIWPWIAQMGESPRGGFYSYLTVERLLGMKVRNADRILPEFQDPEVGEALDRAGTMRVKAVVRNQYLVLGPPPAPDLAVTWSLALFPIDGTTRLVSRCRARLPRGIGGLAARFALDPGQLVMERKMLLEIRKRAEKLAARSHFEILPERKAG